MRRGNSRRRTRKAKKGGGGKDPDSLEVGTAVIVEPRKHRALSYVLRNMVENLPKHWNILVIHGKRNGHWLHDLVSKEFTGPERARISLRSGGFSNLKHLDYSNLLLTREFWASLPTELLLIFQTDSMICPPGRDLLHKFLDHDYSGAPWTDGWVGNGGFSLRRRSKMIEILEKCPPIPGMLEDGVFVSGCEGVEVGKPSAEAAREFSIESVFSPRTFGIHKPWGGIHARDNGMASIEAVCPGARRLHELQGEVGK